MAKQFDQIEEAHQSFIEDQAMFFVGSAGHNTKVNVSPKGMDSLRVLGPNRIIWLNFTGSGNETAAHLAQVNRMTLMWCAFTTRPLILRAYGTARTIHPRDGEWESLIAHWDKPLGARQVYDMKVEMVQTSCGYAVPFMDDPRPRDTLKTWTEDRGPEGIRDYWEEKNQVTIDGDPTGIFE